THPEQEGRIRAGGRLPHRLDVLQRAFDHRHLVREFRGERVSDERSYAHPGFDQTVDDVPTRPTRGSHHQDGLRTLPHLLLWHLALPGRLTDCICPIHYTLTDRCSPLPFRDDTAPWTTS